MPLNPGARLGPYEITGLLGAGGMGEVYRARDTRLDRAVAVKMLPPALADDPQFRERFDREARTISQLTHPHICTLYDIGDALDPTVSATSHQPPATIRFLVMELLEGETLESRLMQGALPIEQALTIGIHVASALDAAHRAGVVHRDLKPGNVMLTKSGAKLLDFGLAKSGVPVVAMSGSVAPTTPPNITAQGTILGTFQYMAPEQIEGLDADARTDIFAFGCLLYEILTGAKAFEGKTRARLIGAILKDEPPPVSQLQPLASPALARLVATCLAKEPDDRWQTARDLMRELQWIEEQGAQAAVATQTGVAASSAAPPKWPLWTIAAAAIAGVVLSAAATWILTRQAPPAPATPTRFAIVPPASQPLSFQNVDRDIAISPDGTTIVYRAGIGQWQFFVRRVDQLDAQQLGSLSNPRAPFFSPDGRWVGFLENGELKKISITGGPPITLCRITASNPRGASWGEDNTIVFATADTATGLMSVPAGGGDPKVLTKPDAAQHEIDHLFPFVLPGGRGVLFTITSPGQGDSSQVAVLDTTTGQRKTLIRGGSQAEYLESGHLVYAVAGTLRAVRFDLARLEVTSDPFPVVEHVLTFGNGAANYAIARNGTLVYVPGGAGAATSPRSLVWVNRNGREEPVNAPVRAYAVARLSPDGTQIALEIRDQDGDIWVWNIAHQTLTRLTFDPGLDSGPVWTPDGKRIIFASTRSGAANLYWHAADGTGGDERLTTSANQQAATAVTPDGSHIVGYETQATPDVVSWLLAAPGGKARETELLVRTAFIDVQPDISPDGRYIAYQSNESGQFQVYVRPFPKVDAGRWQVSTGGGTRPAWARNGRELFYLDASGALTAVPIQTTGSTFSGGNPTTLLRTRYATPSNQRPYDVSADGQRFLIIKDNATTDDKATPASLIVVEHWFDELRQKVSGR